MDSTKERVAIEALFEQLRRAHAEHDSDAITEAYAPDAVIYDLVYRSTVFWTLSPLYSGSLCQAGRQLLLSNLRGRFVAMPPDKPCLIVALLKLQQRDAEFFHRIAGRDPQQVFFARADKTFGTPVAFSVNYTLHGVQANWTPIHWRLRSDIEEWTGTPSPPGLLGGKGQSGLMPATSASPSKATWHSYPRSTECADAKATKIRTCGTAQPCVFARQMGDGTACMITRRCRFTWMDAIALRLILNRSMETNMTEPNNETEIRQLVEN